MRGQWHREVAIERLEEVLDVCNEWNADRIWPKAYVRVRDNGLVHVVSEVATDLEHGATDAQLSQMLFCGLSTGSMFFDALDERYPDPAGVGAVSGPDALAAAGARRAAASRTKPTPTSSDERPPR